MPNDPKQWCDRHYAPIRAGSLAKTHSGIAAQLHVVQRWIEKRAAAGDFPRADDADAVNAELRKDSPLCCWLGDEVMKDVVEASRLKKPAEVKRK